MSAYSKTAILPTRRDVRFKLPADRIADWHPEAGPVFTAFLNTFSIVLPVGERFFIDSVRAYQQRTVRALMGVVLQDVALFNDSIGENIAFARPGASQEDVQAAARAAHADDFIQRMDDQYATLVGERGIKLSGGEKQRVAIARAILKDPQLIILDEATSALDSESEHLVQQGLEQLVSGRTSVIIAHRLSTVMSADLILVLRNGEVLERGNHDALVGHEGLYARLFALQTGRHLAVAH
jgi:ABC-type multidrug transport system fused ATPase/permease subunit